ncbi:DNA-methyltransferase [Halorhabdus rudnickae]|uniref:DNA-methyltransferase n=1 Tax=Halorhabdus rudnickae TaxID=1775544 RepID=UPI001083EFF4|nr:site-specific DNA-methyltransferase [Halorhabdus rudnickae]
MVEKDELVDFIPDSCSHLLDKNNQELRTEIPELARDWEKMIEIENTIYRLPTNHSFINSDSRELNDIEDGSVDLVVTSPPYFNIKNYNDENGQLGLIDEYETFIDELEDVWEECYDKLIPGGRMCVVVGDVLQSRREAGRHRALPLHSSIQEQCKSVGFDNLAPIIWAKIGNAALEAGGNARFLGKPYEPGAVIKNDIEYILLFRKPGKYRSPSTAERVLSTIQVDDHNQFFRQIWTDIQGEKSGNHPAPYPEELAERLIRMYSFVGDTVMDPFAGIGTTTIAASRNGRDSISLEVDEEYLEMAKDRLEDLKPQQRIS